MASLKFFLDRPLDSRATRAVYLRYKTVAPVAGSVSFFPDEPVLILPARWDQKAQRVKGTSLEAQKLNDDLRTLYKRVDDAVKAIRESEGNNEDPTPSQVRGYLGHTKRGSAVGRAGLVKSSPEAAPDTAGKSNSQRLPLAPRTLPDVISYCHASRSQELRKGTLDEYNKTLRCLQRFQPYGNPEWILTRLTPEHMQAWRQWLVTGKPFGADVDNQTANSHLTVVTTCIRYFWNSSPKQYHRLITAEHLKVLLQRFKVHTKKRNSLNAEEFMTFYRTPLPPRMRATLVLVRDVYCLGWCTSLRQSDLFLLKEANVIFSPDAAGTPRPIELDTTSIKTVKTTRLPLNNIAQEIIERWLKHEPAPGYGGTPEEWEKELRRLSWPAGSLFPQMISGSGRRRSLRDIWKQLNLFTEPVEIVRISGGRQQRSIVPRYTLLSLHTSRHGFGNFMAASNVPIEDTSLLMGHTNIKTTSIYYNRPEEQALSRARAALNNLPTGLPETTE